MKSIIEFISNMEILLLHVEEFCDHFMIILKKRPSLEINVEFLLQTGIEILELNPLQIGYVLCQQINIPCHP